MQYVDLMDKLQRWATTHSIALEISNLRSGVESRRARLAHDDGHLMVQTRSRGDWYNTTRVTCTGATAEQLEGLFTDLKS